MANRKNSKAEKKFSRKLRRKLTTPVQIEITDNTYTMISFSRRAGAYSVRLHHMFLKASDTIVSTIAGYIRDDDITASAKLDDYIHRHRDSIRHVPPHIRQQRLPLKSLGRAHDLDSILHEVCAEFFDFDPSEVAISWSTVPRVKLPRSTIKLGSYGADTQIVRIHPAMDQPKVPRFFVRWIIYHELLHHVFRRELKKRRGRIHTPEFMRRERLFPQRQMAMRWEQRNLDILLQWKPCKHKNDHWEKQHRHGSVSHASRGFFIFIDKTG